MNNVPRAIVTTLIKIDAKLNISVFVSLGKFRALDYRAREENSK